MISRELLLPHRVAAWAAEHPDRVYIRNSDGDIRTFEQTHHNALRWAALLRSHGVRPGESVLSLLPVSIAGAELWLGASWLGAVLVPINIEYRGTSLRHAVKVSGARVMVTNESLLAECGEHAEIVDQLELAIVVDGAAVGSAIAAVNLSMVWPAQTPDGNEFPGPRGSVIAAIVFTSGKTGASKGATIHWAQLHATASRYFPAGDFTPDDVYYAPFPLFHISGLVALNVMALCGGSVVLRERFKTQEFWSDVATFGCTTTLLLGAMVQFLASTPATENDSKTPLNKVAMIPLHPDVEAFGLRFGLKICTNYGSSETGTILVSEWNPPNSRSCGRQRPEYEVRIVNDDDEEVPPGTVGECVCRPREPWTSMTGYWNMPQPTSEVFRNQWLHTGDLLYQDEDGNFFYVDRKSDSIRRRGENISSMEVEAEINAHPDVIESAVVGVPSELGEQEVMAMVVVAGSTTLEPDALIEFLGPRLPRYAVPRYVEFVEALPKTPTQKIQKNIIRGRGVTGSTWDRGGR